MRSPLVIVPVSVTDAKGRFVSDLDASDFMVFDNGRAQKATVDTIDTGVAPIALVVAVQSSGISAAVIEKTRKIGVMIRPMVTGGFRSENQFELAGEMNGGDWKI